jgi:2,3-bisphosphoglycerate-dependent phosphoglycerate mutase
MAFILLLLLMISCNNSFKIILVRHGISKWNYKNLYTGWYDSDLMNEGLKNSFKVGELLNEYKVSPNIIFTSQQRRAIDTSLAIKSKLKKKNIKVVKNWKLNERHYGNLTGLNKLDPNYRVKLKYFEKPPLIYRSKDDIILNSIPNYGSGDYANYVKEGESLEMVSNRLIPYFYDVIIKSNTNLLIVSHKNALKTLIRNLEGIPYKNINDIEVHNSLPIIYDYDISNKIFKKIVI